MAVLCISSMNRKQLASCSENNLSFYCREQYWKTVCVCECPNPSKCGSLDTVPFHWLVTSGLNLDLSLHRKLFWCRSFGIQRKPARAPKWLCCTCLLALLFQLVSMLICGVLFPSLIHEAMAHLFGQHHW